MNDVGIGHHLQYSHLTVMDQQGQVLRSRPAGEHSSGNRKVPGGTRRERWKQSSKRTSELRDGGCLGEERDRGQALGCVAIGRRRSLFELRRSDATLLQTIRII